MDPCRLHDCASLQQQFERAMQELYVRPEFRSKKLGFRLVSQARSFALSRGWRRLEVTTPPLPEFDRTLAFYEREGFSVTGGRKLKLAL